MLDVARGLVVQIPFDPDVVLSLLGTLPSDELPVQIRGAIRHAQITSAEAVNGGPSHSALARFALARVVTLLDGHVDSA